MENPNLIKINYKKDNKAREIKIIIAFFFVGLLVGLLLSCVTSYAQTNIIYDYRIKQNVMEVKQDTNNNPFSGINISKEEFEELRWVVALESGHNNFDDKKAVVETILNRCISNDDFGQNSKSGAVHGVLSKKGQFSTYRYVGSRKAWTTPGEMDDDAISEVLRMGLTVLPSNRYVYFDSKGGVNGKNHIKIKGGNTYGEK